jgi:hypothetical protein
VVRAVRAKAEVTPCAIARRLAEFAGVAGLIAGF